MRQYYYRERINDTNKKFIPALPDGVFPCQDRDPEAEEWDRILEKQRETKKILFENYLNTLENGTAEEANNANELYLDFLNNSYKYVTYKIIGETEKSYKVIINQKTGTTAYISKKLSYKINILVVGIKKWLYDKLEKYL